jgi:hypothetical protein
MSETAPESTEAAQPNAETNEAANTPAEESTDWKSEARKWEQRAKENREAARELEKQRQASMTEAERAVAEAEQRGRTTAVTEFGKRLARSQFDALAAKRNPDADTGSILEFVDLARFVGDDGEPDTKALSAAVERLVPAASAGTYQPPSFDGGSRTPAPAHSSMSGLIRKAAGRA